MPATATAWRIPDRFGFKWVRFTIAGLSREDFIEALIQLSVRRFGTGWFYPVLCMAVNFSSILVLQARHYTIWKGSAILCTLYTWSPSKNIVSYTWTFISSIPTWILYWKAYKLNIFGRLCNSNDTCILKCIFWRRLTLAIADQRSNKTQIVLFTRLSKGSVLNCSDIVESLLGRPLSFVGVPLSRREISNSWCYRQLTCINLGQPYFHDPLFWGECLWGAMWELNYLPKLFEIISLFQTINEHIYFDLFHVVWTSYIRT
jgi:hypothetical protein